MPDRKKAGKPAIPEPSAKEEVMRWIGRTGWLRAHNREVSLPTRLRLAPIKPVSVVNLAPCIERPLLLFTTPLLMAVRPLTFVLAPPILRWGGAGSPFSALPTLQHIACGLRRRGHRAQCQQRKNGSLRSSEPLPAPSSGMDHYFTTRPGGQGFRSFVDCRLTGTPARSVSGSLQSD